MDEYENYIEIKGWSDLFSYSKSDAWQFEKILAGIPTPPQKILEVGFGSGALMMYLRDQGADVFGIEIQPRLIDAAINQRFNVSDTLDSFNEHRFDLIIALDVLEHLDKNDMRAFLENVKSMLSNQGVLVARFPNCQSPASMFNQFGDHTHLQMLSVPIMRNYLKDHGLEIFEVRKGYASTEYCPNLLKRLIKSLTKLVCEKIVKIALGYSSNTLASNIIIYAKTSNATNS